MFIKEQVDTKEVEKFHSDIKNIILKKLSHCEYAIDTWNSVLDNQAATYDQKLGCIKSILESHAILLQHFNALESIAEDKFEKERSLLMTVLEKVSLFVDFNIDDFYKLARTKKPKKGWFK